MAIRVTRMSDGRCSAYVEGSPSVGVETSLASQARGEEQVGAAIEALRKLYDRLPLDMPVSVYGVDGVTKE